MALVRPNIRLPLIVMPDPAQFCLIALNALGTVAGHFQGAESSLPSTFEYNISFLRAQLKREHYSIITTGALQCMANGKVAWCLTCSC